MRKQVVHRAFCNCSGPGTEELVANEQQGKSRDQSFQHPPVRAGAI